MRRMAMDGFIDTRLGPLCVRESGGRIVALDWARRDGVPSRLEAEALAQLAAWFAGRLVRFDLPIGFAPGLAGEVQRQMVEIPFGETRTYGDLARALGKPAQAIGQACGANPLPIIVPCHRVLGARGLGGFSAPGGVEAKVWLLRHEGAAGLLI